MNLRIIKDESFKICLGAAMLNFKGDPLGEPIGESVNRWVNWRLNQKLTQNSEIEEVP